MKKTIYTIFPWMAPAPSHVDYAKKQLEEARIRLLDERQAMERAAANCDQLQRRIARLESYIEKNNSSAINPAVQ
jgi:sRNA-binding protein